MRPSAPVGEAEKSPPNLCDQQTSPVRASRHVAIPASEAKRYLVEWSGIEFDPKVVKAFLSLAELPELGQLDAKAIAREKATSLAVVPALNGSVSSPEK